MHASLETAQLFNAGYCKQLTYLADGKGRGTRRFYAVFVYLEHPLHGEMLIDTGYGPWFFEATRAFPQRLYRWLTPVRLPPEQHTAQVLRTHSIDPDHIKTIFISHFHADHIGGLRFFPKAQFVYLQEAYDRLKTLRPWQQMRHAFLPPLLPDDFAARSTGISLHAFRDGDGSLAELRVYDYFDDGSVVLVDLPGHAYGHLGFLLHSDPDPLFYVTDACWNIEILTHQRPLPALSRRVQENDAAYRETLKKLGRVQQAEACRMLACHCPHTQAYVENPED